MGDQSEKPWKQKSMCMYCFTNVNYGDDRSQPSKNWKNCIEMTSIDKNLKNILRTKVLYKQACILPHMILKLAQASTNLIRFQQQTWK